LFEAAEWFLHPETNWRPVLLTSALILFFEGFFDDVVVLADEQIRFGEPNCLLQKVPGSFLRQSLSDCAGNATLFTRSYSLKSHS
jgi:hypothetical protein